MGKKMEEFNKNMVKMVKKLNIKWHETDKEMAKIDQRDKK